MARILAGLRVAVIAVIIAPKSFLGNPLVHGTTAIVIRILVRARSLLVNDGYLPQSRR